LAQPRATSGRRRRFSRKAQRGQIDPVGGGHLGPSQDCRLSVHDHRAQFGCVRHWRGGGRVGIVRHSRIDRGRRGGGGDGERVPEARPTVQGIAARRGRHVRGSHRGLQYHQQGTEGIRRVSGGEAAGGRIEQDRRPGGGREAGRPPETTEGGGRTHPRPVHLCRHHLPRLGTHGPSQEIRRVPSDRGRSPPPPPRSASIVPRSNSIPIRTRS